MKRMIAAVLCACMMMSVVVIPTQADDICARFRDVNPSAWYHEGVHFMVSNGLMSGTAVDAFSPNACITRGMVVTILYQMSGSPSIAGTSRFTDVSEKQYFYYPTVWAYNVGIVYGTSNTTFHPKQNITSRIWRLFC